MIARHWRPTTTNLVFYEAIAVYPVTGASYETEDSGSAGFYRCAPTTYGKPHAGGTLEMLKIVGQHQADRKRCFGALVDSEHLSPVL